MTTEAINTINDFALGADAIGIRPMIPILIRTREQGYRTAAWILAMSETLPDDQPGSTFDEIRTAIEAS